MKKILLALVVVVGCGHKQPVSLGASGGGSRPAIIPASWTASAWAVDNANVSTCASDNNNCTQTTCGGAGTFQGPCLTYQEIASRWGTYAPRLQQTTTLTVMSNMASTDLVYLNPFMEGTGHVFNITCTLGATQQAWSQALGVVTARNQSTGALQQAVITPAAVAANQYLVNSTLASSAFITQNVAGTTWNFSQPITGCSSASSCTPSEVTWTTGNTVTAYVPSNVYLAQALPQAAGANVNASVPGIFINGCTLQTPTGAVSASPLLANQYVQMVNTLVRPAMQDSPSGAGGPTGGGFVNVGFLGVIRGIQGGNFSGGYLNSGSYDVIQTPHFVLGTELFDAVIIQGTRGDGFEGAASLNDVYFNNNLVIENGFATLTGVLWTASSPLWVDSGAFFQYPSGGTGAATNLLGASLHLNGASTACSSTGGATPTIACGISITAAHLDAAAGAAGFGGNAFALGGGQYSNVAQ